MGSFYGNIVNLSAELQEDEGEKVSNMNETVVVDKPNDELIVTILQEEANAGQDSDEEEVEQDHKWDKIRSPTPPKASPRVENTHGEDDDQGHLRLFKAITEEDHKTPTPPQLLSVKSRALFKPIQDMNATFDLNQDDQNEGAEAEVNSTVVLSKDPEEAIEEPEASIGNSTIIISSNLDAEAARDVGNATIILSKESMEEPSANSTIVIANPNADQGASPVLKVAKVAPMVPQVKTNSAPVVNRRVPLANSRRPLMRSGVAGTKSSSNLVRAVERLTLPTTSHEAPPDLRTPVEAAARNIPSYLKPTTASFRKTKVSSGSTPSRSPNSQSNENLGPGRSARTTGVTSKQRVAPLRKDGTTLKPINK